MSTPLSKKHFCIVPWVHLHLSPNGEIHSCCRSDFKHSLGSFHQDSLETIWNNEPIKKMRLDMIADKKLSNCSDCYQQEANHQVSMRMKANDEFRESLSRVEDTLPDGSLKDFEPAFLDLRFNNICNFKCRTCGPHFSTSWYSDCEELNVVIDAKKQSASVDDNLMWAELLKLVPYLKRIYFAGGEPLIQKDHYLFLQHLLDLGRSDITLCYNTNLSTLNFGDKNILDFWNQFDDVWIHASIDGIEKKGEYIRKGTNWQEVYSNRFAIKKECPHVKFVVYWTLSIFNAFHLIEALDFFFLHLFIESGDQIEINILNAPQIYNIRLFNSKERDELSELYHSYIKRLESSDCPRKEKLIDQLSYILAYLQDAEWGDQRKNFWAFNRKLDRVRNENFVNLFPELKSLYEIPFPDQNEKGNH